MQISEKDYAVIDIISNNNRPNQRTIAKSAGISLGMANIIIKRLVTTGYIKISHLNKGKIEYLLTPKGFAEKAQKTYNYTLRTIESLKVLKEKIQALIQQVYAKGRKNYYVLGKGELSHLIEIALHDLKLSDIRLEHVQKDDIQKVTDGVLLVADQDDGDNYDRFKTPDLDVFNIIRFLSQ